MAPEREAEVAALRALVLHPAGLALGASVTSVHRETRRAELAVEGGAPVLRWRDEETQFWSVRPMAVVNLLHGPMLISYTLEVDIDREHVVHVFQLGARF